MPRYTTTPANKGARTVLLEGWQNHAVFIGPTHAEMGPHVAKLLNRETSGEMLPDELIGHMKAYWEACGPWVPDEDLTEEGLRIKRQFEAMLADDRVGKVTTGRESA